MDKIKENNLTEVSGGRESKWAVFVCNDCQHEQVARSNANPTCENCGSTNMFPDHEEGR